MTAPLQHPPHWELDTCSDEVLVALSRDGRPEAFGVLVRRHRPVLVRIAMGMMRHEAEAMDCVQEALLNAWRKLHTFRGEASFGGWLARITRNACLMRLRWRRRRPEVPLVLGADRDQVHERPLPDPRPGPDAPMLTRELGGRIDAAVAALPPHYRQVFELADLRHLSMREIAERLDLSIPNVKTRLHRARRRLRSELEPYLAGVPRPEKA
jgi:RNA polymerase sigma-70 factor, ECF subfamily